MKYYRSVALVVVLSSGTHLAFAAAEYQVAAPGSPENKLTAVLPIVVFLAIVLIYLRQQRKSPATKQQQEYIERNTEHMERVEQALERIAVSLEQRNKPQPPSNG